MKPDQRMVLAYLFVVGYFGVIFATIFQRTSLANADLVKDWMIVLGPPVGAIVGALFRTDRVDEQRADNTGRALDAIKAAQESPAPVKPTVTLDPGQAATVAAAPAQPEGN